MFKQKNLFRLIIELLVILASLIFAFVFRNKDPVIELNYAIAPAVLAALIAGGASIASVIGTNLANRSAVREQNEYNSPESQMQRYRAAGLSPNLIYGSGTASAGLQSSPVHYEAPKVSSQDLLNAASAISTIKSTNANTRKLEAEATSVHLDNDFKLARNQEAAQRYSLETTQMALNNEYLSGRINLQEYQRAVMQAQQQSLIESSLLNRANRENIPYLNGLRQAEINTSIRRLNWDMSPSNPLNRIRLWEIDENNPINRLRSKQTSILDKDLFYYEKDRHWRNAGTVVRGLGTLGGIGLGSYRLFGGKSGNYYSDWSPSYSGTR